MPTQAISSYGIQIWMGDGVPTVAVGVTGAVLSGGFVTLTCAHGVPVGRVTTVTVAGVGGMTGVNGTWQAHADDATHLTLRGPVAAGTWTSGGSVTPTDTYHMVACITNLEDAGVMATLVDASCHDGNGYVSRVPTFLNGNTIRVTYNLIPTDYTHNGLTGFPELMITRARRHWIIVFPDADKTAWSFTAFVASNRDQAPVQGILTGVATLEMVGVPLLATAPATLLMAA